MVQNNSGDVKIDCLIGLQCQNGVKMASDHCVDSLRIVTLKTATPNSKNLPHMSGSESSIINTMLYKSLQDNP